MGKLFLKTYFKVHSGFFSIMYIIWPFQRSFRMTRILNGCKIFPMLPDLFYLKSSFFPKWSLNSKLGFLRIGCRKNLVFLAIFFNVALGWIPKLPNSEIEIWYFSMLANRLHYQIFPNSLKRYGKFGLLNIGQITSNEQEWMEVGSF